MNHESLLLEAAAEIGRIRATLAELREQIDHTEAAFQAKASEAAEWLRQAREAQAELARLRKVDTVNERLRESMARLDDREGTLRAQLATAEARVKELEEKLLHAQLMGRRKDERRCELEARLRAVTEAVSVFADKFRKTRWGYDGDCGTAALVETLEYVADAARSGDLPPHPDTEIVEWLSEHPESLPYLEDGIWRIPYLVSGAGGFGGGVGEMTDRTFRGVVGAARAQAGKEGK